MPSQNMLDCLLKISFTYGSMVVLLSGAEIQIDIFKHHRCSLEIRSVRLRVCIIYKFPSFCHFLCVQSYMHRIIAYLTIASLIKCICCMCATELYMLTQNNQYAVLINKQ